MSPKIVVFTGAGISAESGIKTFRDSNGLWELMDPKKVATKEAWDKDPQTVLRFYNNRSQQIQAAQPNAAHTALTLLENKFDVQIITQNIDDLHERAGSTKIIHLHGSVFQSRSTGTQEVFPNDNGIAWGQTCPQGFQLRPNIVLFNEDIHKAEEALKAIRSADLLLIIGTSLLVQPAASFVKKAHYSIRKFLIDPEVSLRVKGLHKVSYIHQKATQAVPLLVDGLLSGSVAFPLNPRS